MNLALISVDNLRFDCLGYQDDKRELIKHGVAGHLKTDTLDVLAEKSVCFSRCISTNTYTTASHASMFTGLYPPNHGVRGFYETKLGDVTTLAEILAGHGYRTVFFSDAPELFLPIGLARGFEHTLSGRDDDLFSTLKSLKGEKVFFFCHFMDVHAPFMRCEYEYEPGVNRDYQEELFRTYVETVDLASPEKLRSKENLDWRYLTECILKDYSIKTLFPMYVKGVTKFDRGRLCRLMEGLSEMDFMASSLVALLSDHGEGRCFADPSQKEFFGHGGIVYDNVIRVPLMISHPELEPEIDDRLVSTADLLPTLLSLLSIPCGEALDGIDALAGERDAAYSEHWISTKGHRDLMDDLKEAEGMAPGEMKSGWPEFMLYEMSMRTKTRKYIRYVRNDVRDYLEGGPAGLANSDFVKGLYRNLLGRFEDPEGVRYHAGRIDGGALSRKDVVAEFVSTGEFKKLEGQMPRFTMYDLESDHEEDAPRDVTDDPEGRPHFESMERLNAGTVETEGIFDKERSFSLTGENKTGHVTEPANEPDPEVDEEAEEREMLLAKLKDLGYF